MEDSARGQLFLRPPEAAVLKTLLQAILQAAAQPVFQAVLGALLRAVLQALLQAADRAVLQPLGIAVHIAVLEALGIGLRALAQAKPMPDTSRQAAAAQVRMVLLFFMMVSSLKSMLDGASVCPLSLGTVRIVREKP